MKNIKVFDDSVVDLRSKESSEDEPNFKVSHIEEEEAAPVQKKHFTAVDHSDLDVSSVKSSNMIRVRFDKFLALLSKYDYESAVSNFMNEEIIISTDLLADLASPKVTEEEEIEEPKKFPVWILVGGIVVGIAITWLIYKL